MEDLVLALARKFLLREFETIPRVYKAEFDINRHGRLRLKAWVNLNDNFKENELEKFLEIRSYILEKVIDVEEELSVESSISPFVSPKENLLKRR